MKPEFRKLRNEVMKRLKIDCPAKHEVHHLFGRTGRLAACEMFCAPVPVLPGAINHHDGQEKLLSKFKSQWRVEYNLCQVANYQNRDQTKCWYRHCDFWQRCPLAEEMM